MSQKTHGVIAAGHQKTAEAGIEMLHLGGNAFDATAAAILASFVTEPMLTSAAGGGFLLAHTQNQQNILFDFFTQTPRQKKNHEHLDFSPVELNFGGALQTFHIGLGSMAVPGNLQGVFHVHRKLGRLPFPVVASPAIHYAKNGVELNEYQTYSLNLLKPIIFASPEACKMYAPAGKLLELGDILLMRDLGATLAELAENGPEEFYLGEIAKQLVKDCQDKGGYLTEEDLKSYQVIERDPLRLNYRGHNLLTNPPPSSGGCLMAFALQLLSNIDLSLIESGSSAHLQILAEVMRLTNEARTDGYDAYIYQKDIAERFLSSEHSAPYEKQLTETVSKWGSTTHISVIDNEGNAASVTTSNGEGSSYVIPGTGIMVNNMLGEDDLNPSGFHKWPVNQRISSMMSPTMVLKDGKPEIVLGSGGSKRIRTAIFQVISNLIDFKMPLSIAVENPRCHWENDQLNIEPGFREEEVENLLLQTHTQLVPWQQKNMFFGGVHTVRSSETGVMEGSGDPRRNGVAIARA
ncbi:MAG: gamma-glutamyltransferase [Aphanothece sp. CMT-3BRIN-NPC111]|jgi:gamma-glutamyltranspeptidase/glutathione hydrolase|nr:gamma-glutamyltransferase [Aphanothece sp. CMT-3BRIN-NPC111]